MSVGGSIADGLRQFARGIVALYSYQVEKLRGVKSKDLAQCAAWTDGAGPHWFGPGGDNDRCVYCGAPSLAAYARAYKAGMDGAN